MKVDSKISGIKLFKQIVEAGWDVTGRDKKANQYIQGMKSFTTYLANKTKITKLKNYKK